MDADTREELKRTLDSALSRWLNTPHADSYTDIDAMADALLADGRWLLVHPDEMIRRDELEQVGWAYERHGGTWGYSPIKLSSDVPVFRVRPAVEKENDQ